MEVGLEVEAMMVVGAWVDFDMLVELATSTTGSRVYSTCCDNAGWTARTTNVVSKLATLSIGHCCAQAYVRCHIGQWQQF